MREKHVRRTVSLSPKMAEKIDSIAVRRHVTVGRAIVDLLNDAITSYERDSESTEAERLRDQIARMNSSTK
jgi:hypothetical protein